MDGMDLKCSHCDMAAVDQYTYHNEPNLGQSQPNAVNIRLISSHFWSIVTHLQGLHPE